MSGRLRAWLGQLWDDLRESTDPSLLGIARFFGAVYGPIDRSSRIDEAWRRMLRRRLPAHVGWRHALGGVTYVLLMVLVVTGVLLSFYYRPSAQEAYPSIQYVVSEVSFGWLVRDVHVWAASLLVVVLLAHMARVFFAAAYKPPRETNWLVGVGLVAVVLAFGASGYLLPWDQWSYWTVTEALDTLGRVPLVGRLGRELLLGDDLVSGATLSRYFALHVIVLPWLLFALVGLHFALTRRHGVAPPVGGAVTGPGVPFYPWHAMRVLTTAVLVVAVVVTVAVLFPRPVGPPADPGQMPESLDATWVAVGVWRSLVYYGGVVAVLGFGLLGVVLAALPLVDRDPERQWRQRPVATGLGVLFAVAVLALWLAGRGLETRGPVLRQAAPAAADTAVPFGGPLERPGPTPIVPAAPDTAARSPR